MSTEVKFYSINQFKEQIGATEIQVLKNEKTGKLFMSASNGESYKVEQAIDSTKDMRVLVADGVIADACLVNVSGGATPVFSI